MSDEYDPRLQVSGNMQIVGPSLSGKTTWLYRLVRDAPVYFRRADGSPCFFKKIVYCYGSHWQPIFEDFQALGVIFHPNLPDDLETLFPPEARPGMLILDDLMQEAVQSPSHPTVNAWDASFGIVCDHIDAKLVSGRSRTSDSKSQLPLQRVISKSR